MLLDISSNDADFVIRSNATIQSIISELDTMLINLSRMNDMLQHIKTRVDFQQYNYLYNQVILTSYYLQQLKNQLERLERDSSKQVSNHISR